jgi:hypothetical protein
VATVPAHTCSTELCFDVTKAAGFHAGLSAFLAGVSFTAVVLIVDAERRDGDEHTSDIGISAFVAAFFCLIVAAFLYGTAAGEEVTSSRAALLTLVSGVALGVGVMDLFAGIVWLMSARGGAALSDLVARIVATVVPTLTFYYLAYTMTNVDRLSSGGDLGSRLDARLLLASLCVLVVILIAFQLLWKSSIVDRALRRAPMRQRHAIVVVTVVSTGISVAMAVLAGALLEESPHVTVPSWLFDASAGGLLVGEVLFAYFIRLVIATTRSAPRHVPR